MNPSHERFPHRRPPFSVWRLFLSRFQTTSRLPRDLSRLFAGLFLGVACLTSQATAALIFGEPTTSPTLGGGFEGGAADWDGIPWGHNTGATLSVSTTAREGNNSVRFLPATIGVDTRSELTIGALGRYNWGTEYWVGFSFRVIQPTQGNGIICQHHAVQEVWTPGLAAGPNSFTIHINGSNLEFVTSTNDTKVNVVPDSNSAFWGTEILSGATRPFSLNTWYDIVMHFRYAPDSTGYIQVWMNGTQVINNTGPNVYLYDQAGNLRATEQSQKIGIYYGGNKDNPPPGGELLYDAFRIWEGPGGSYADVAPGGGGTVPNPPTGLTATPASSTQINLDWNPVSPTPTGYRVYRGATAGTVTSNVSGNLGSGTTAFNNTGLTPGQTYFYAARAYNSTDESGNSNIVSATTSGGGTTVTFTSAATLDGWVRESGETTGVGNLINSTDATTSALLVGDDTAKRQYKAILSFDTSSLPDNATILSATLKLKRGTQAGTVTPLGTLYADQRTYSFNGNGALETADFNAAASVTQAATLSVPTANGALASGNLTSAGLTAINKVGTTQFRVYFSVDDDNDTTADYIGFYSGNDATAANRPVLEVTYQ